MCCPRRKAKRVRKARMPRDLRGLAASGAASVRVPIRDAVQLLSTQGTRGPVFSEVSRFAVLNLLQVNGLACGPRAPRARFHCAHTDELSCATSRPPTPARAGRGTMRSPRRRSARRARVCGRLSGDHGASGWRFARSLCALRPARFSRRAYRPGGDGSFSERHPGGGNSDRYIRAASVEKSPFRFAWRRRR